jgi:hypothetical protein
MLRRVALVRTDVSEEPGAYFIRVTRTGELGTTQAATSNRRTLRRNAKFNVTNPHSNATLTTEFTAAYKEGGEHRCRRTVRKLPRYVRT